MLIAPVLPDKPKRDGFEDLYRKYVSQMIKTAMKILQDEYPAREAVMEAFIRMSHHTEKIADADSYKMGAVLVIFVRESAIDISRKRRSQSPLSSQEWPKELNIEGEEGLGGIKEAGGMGELPGPGRNSKPNIEKLLMNNEILPKAAKQIGQLPVQAADILALKYFYHYQDKEIARMLNLTLENTRNRLERAEERLLALLTWEQGSRSMNKSDPALTPVKEKMLEIIFEYAAACHVENIAAEYPLEDGDISDLLLPPEFDRKMKKLLARLGRKQAWAEIRKFWPQAAIFLLILLASLTILVANVEALRVKTLNLMLSAHDRYMSVRTADKNSSPSAQADRSLNRDKSFYQPGYLPPGFEVAHAEQRDLLAETSYRDKQGRIIRFTQYFSSNTDLRIDTENAMVEHTEIHGEEAVWKEDCLLYLTGEADKAEIVKMAESISKNQ